MTAKLSPTDFFDRVGRAWRRDADLPATRKISKAARWTAQRLTAPLFLAACDEVGPGARTWGRPRVRNAGRITIGARATLASTFAPVELRTSEAGVIEIGDDAAFNFGVRISADARVTIGDRVSLGPHVSISDTDDAGDRGRDPEPVVIGDDVWLAARVRVRKGAVIGAGSVITAGSEVRGTIPPNVIAGGVPARVLRARNAEAAPPPQASCTAEIPKAATPAHRGLLVADFSIQELARHLAADDPLGPTIGAAVAPFDQIVPTLHDIEARVAADAIDFALVWARPESIASFRAMRNGDGVALDAILSEVDALASLLRAAASHVPHLFVASFALSPDQRGLGMIDLRPGGLAHAVLQMNARLVDALAQAKNVYLLDAQRWIEAGGARAVRDELWYHAKIGFSSEVLAEAARDVRAALRGVRGAAKKLVVLDLDDTLWGGIVGDVGWEGLRLGGHDAVGEAFVDFQRELKALSRRGVLLAIASKNEESVALEAIDRHPEMVLRRNDFIARRIHWRDKASSIAEIAQELNLGLQSIVFIDDNPAERARVREALPEVHVPDWPEDKLAYARALRSLRCFDVPVVSREDAERAAMMASDRARDALKANVGSIDDWLQSLGIRARFSPLDPSTLARTTQLLNKTNQMNLTTRRLGETELAAWAAERGHELWSISVSDRIGESGLTGIFSLEVRGDVVRIVDFVLSCRVMGRRIEEAMVAFAVRRARELGARVVEAVPRETAKNKPCRDFWDRSGFAREGEALRWDAERAYATPPCIDVRIEGGDAHV